jgi:hypothetical protein
VARGRAAGAGGRGGDRIPALRASRVRAVAALAALAGGGALGAYAIATAGARAEAVDPLSVGGLVLLVAALVWSTRALAWALLAFGAAYVVGVVLADGAAATSIPYGGGLLLVGELAAWSVTLRAVERVERRVVTRKAGVLAATGAGGAGAAALALGAARISVGGGLGTVALGLAATVAAIGVVAAAARSTAP